MNFEKFANIVVTCISEYLEDVDVRVECMKKNNGLDLHGLVFHDNVNISPIICIDSYYQEYEDGRSMGDIMTEIMNVYQNNKLEDSVDISFFMDFNNVKASIIYCLVNYEQNQELLKEIPHYRFLDLAIIFKVFLGMVMHGVATILIRNQHLDVWNINQDVLMDLAINNTPKILQYEVLDMGTLKDKLFEMDNIVEDEMGLEIPMYVLSNTVKMHGAISILYKDVLKELSGKLNADLYILPSSIHETIIVPVMNDIVREELSEIVKDVNRSQLSREEILSDHEYFYDRKTNEIKM